VASGPEAIQARVRIDTTTPAEVFRAVTAFFREATPEGQALAGVGVATFGPVDVRDEGSPDYGRIKKTPKAGWAGASWVEGLRELTGGPLVVVDSDVNGAALGEARWGAAKGLGTVVYVTVGTGIGGGILVGGHPVHGLLHPEIGHMRVPREAGDDFAGVCPFHADCLEGLASGPAIAARWGREGKDLPEDHEAWALQADYLASMCVNLALTVSPERIILGGGVMQVPRVFGLVRDRFIERLGGYLDMPEIVEHVDSYIVAPKLGQDAGLMGALALIQGRLAGE
jgi:fructokinase